MCCLDLPTATLGSRLDGNDREVRGHLLGRTITGQLKRLLAPDDHLDRGSLRLEDVAEHPLARGVEAAGGRAIDVDDVGVRVLSNRGLAELLANEIGQLFVLAFEVGEPRTVRTMKTLDARMGLELNTGKRTVDHGVTSSSVEVNLWPLQPHRSPVERPRSIDNFLVHSGKLCPIH